MADREIKTRLVLEGEQQFRTAMNNATSAVRSLNAEEKAAEAQFKATGDAEAYRTEKARILNEKLEEQKKAVDAAQEAVKRLTEQGVQRNDRAMQQWRTKLANAQTALAQTQAKLNGLDGALNTTSQQMDNASQAAADLSASVQSIGQRVNMQGAIDSIGRIEDSVRGAIRTVAGLGQRIWNLEADAANWADSTITEAAQAGLDVETYQAWQFASELVDTSVSDILSATTRMNSQILRESPQVARALGQIGVAFADRSSEDVFWDTIRALNAMEDVTQRNNYAQTIFGNSYRNLIPLIDAGAGAWEDAVAEAREYYVLNEDQVGRLGSLDDALTRLGASLTTTKLEILSALAPTFESIASAMATAVNALNDFLATEEGQQMLADLGAAVQDLVLSLIDQGPEGFRSALNAARSVVEGFTGALNWIKDNSTLVIAAIGAIAAALIAVKIGSGLMNFINFFQSMRGLGGRTAGRALDTLTDTLTDTVGNFLGDLFGGGSSGGKGGSGLPGVGGGEGGGILGGLGTALQGIEAQLTGIDTHATSLDTNVSRMAGEVTHGVGYLADLAADLERMAWAIENAGAIRGAARARAMGANEWADLLTGGAATNPYTGNIEFGGLAVEDASAGGTNPKRGPRGKNGAAVGASAGSAELYAEQLAYLMGQDLTEYLSAETARMLYQGTDASGRVLDPDQIVPQVLAELAAYAESVGYAGGPGVRPAEEPEEPREVEVTGQDEPLEVRLTGQDEPVDVRLTEPQEPIRVTLEGFGIYAAWLNVIDNDIRRIISLLGGRNVPRRVGGGEDTDVRILRPFQLTPPPGNPLEQVAEDTDTLATDEANRHVWHEQRAIVIDRQMSNLQSTLDNLASYTFYMNGAAAQGEDYGATWGMGRHPAFFGTNGADGVFAVADIAYGMDERGFWRRQYGLENPRAYGIGGRVGGAQFAMIGEDGAEYVIPVDQTARAFDLTMAMLAENLALRGAVTRELTATVDRMSGAVGGRVVPGGGGGGWGAQGLAQALQAVTGQAAGAGGVTARIYMDKREVGYMVADTVNEVMGATVSASRRGE